MSTKSKIKQREGYRCQICGDYQGKIYDSGLIVVVQAHHIIPKSRGGRTFPENEITLCDLCHAVFHEQRWKEHFGEKGTPENIKEILQDFEKYIKLDLKEREKVKEEIWSKLGIT